MASIELELLHGLLQRFAEHELDQFDHLRFDTSHGPVYVTLARELPPDWPAEAFRPVPAPARAETGRFAQVSEVESVESRDDLTRVITQMREDLAGAGDREWENATLERFLEALQCPRRPGRLLLRQPRTAATSAAGLASDRYDPGRSKRLRVISSRQISAPLVADIVQGHGADRMLVCRLLH